MKTISAASKLAAIAFFLCCSAALAQEPPVPMPVPVTLKTPSQAGPAAALTSSLRREIEPGRTVTVVTVAEPLLRQTCKVESFEKEKLVCGPKGSAKDATYGADDLIAVIKTDSEFHWPSPLKLLVKFGFGGGALAGAALLAATSMVAAVPLAIIGTIFLLDAAIESTDSGGPERPRERLIFMNPNQLLQITLK